MQCGNKIPYGFYKKINTQWTTIFIVYSWRSWFIVSTNRPFSLFFFTVEREHVQKKTFTKWVNSHLTRINCRVADLYTDLRDGKLLIKLLEILSGERLVCFSVCLFSKLFDYIIVSHGSLQDYYFIEIFWLGLEISGFMKLLQWNK